MTRSSEYVVRCMAAGLESYEKAHTEIARTPPEEDFATSNLRFEEIIQGTNVIQRK